MEPSKVLKQLVVDGGWTLKQLEVIQMVLVYRLVLRKWSEPTSISPKTHPFWGTIHPPWYPAFRSSGASLSIFEVYTYIKYGTIMQEVWVLSPETFAWKKKNSKMPTARRSPFFSGMRRSSWEGRPQRTQHVKLWAAAWRRSSFCWGRDLLLGAPIDSKRTIFLCNCNKHQEVSIFNFRKNHVRQESVPAPWKNFTSSPLHIIVSFCGRQKNWNLNPEKKAINKRPQVMLAKDRCPTSNFQGRLQLAVSLGSTSIFQPKPCSAMGSYQRFIGRMSLEGYVYKLCHLEATIPTGKDHLPATIFEGQAISFNFDVLAGRSQSSNFFYHL